MKITSQFNNVSNYYKTKQKKKIKKNVLTTSTNTISFGMRDNMMKRAFNGIKRTISQISSSRVISSMLPNLVLNRRRNDAVETQTQTVSPVEIQTNSPVETQTQVENKEPKNDNIPISGNIPKEMLDEKNYIHDKFCGQNMLMHNNEDYFVTITEPEIEKGKITGGELIEYTYKTQRDDKLIHKSYVKPQFDNFGNIKEALNVNYTFKNKNNRHKTEEYHGVKFNENGGVIFSKKALIKFTQSNFYKTNEYKNAQYYPDGRLKTSEEVILVCNKNPYKLQTRRFAFFELDEIQDKITYKGLEETYTNGESKIMVGVQLYPNGEVKKCKKLIKSHKYSNGGFETKTYMNPLFNHSKMSYRPGKIVSCKEYILEYKKNQSDNLKSEKYTNVIFGHFDHIQKYDNHIITNS